MNYIDLSKPEPSWNWVFGYREDTPRRTPTGLSFCSFAGLRKYLITGSKHAAYLNGWDINKELPYVHVPDLHQQLVDAVILNMGTATPFIKLKYNANTEVVWTKPGITQEELEWVEVIRAVLKHLG